MMALYDFLIWTYCIILIVIFSSVFDQADPETDEVYAQMTLQPVNKVGQLFNQIIYWYVSGIYFQPFLEHPSWPMIWNLLKIVFDVIVLHFYSMTRKHYWHQTWVSNKTNNLPSSFAKHLQLVTQALMVDFLFLVEQRRKYSHLWCVFNIFIYPANDWNFYVICLFWSEVCLIGFFNATSSSGDCCQRFAWQYMDI